MQKSTTERFMALFGTAFEYYDFVLFAFMSLYISSHFFPDTDLQASLLKSWMVFGLGYIARPIGALFFGFYATLRGTAAALVLQMFGMALTTLGIALLPTFATIGITASILLVTFRLVQGFCYGAELPTAMVFLSENATLPQWPLMVSWLMSSATIGAVLASSLTYILPLCFTEPQLHAYGWRVPFLLGAGLALVAYQLRKKHLHKHERTMVSSEWSSLKSYWYFVIPCTGVLCLITTCIIMPLYFPTFFKVYHNISGSTIALATTYSLLYSIFFTPLCGLLTRYIAPRILLAGAFLGTFALYGGPYWTQPITHTLETLTLFFIAHQTLLSLYLVTLFPYVLHWLPKAHRTLLLALSYNLAFVISSFFPSLATWLIQDTSDPTQINKIILSVACFSLLLFIGIWPRSAKK